jgi:hypothetical protein
MPYPILTDGLKEDHPEWFGDQENDETCPQCGGVGDQHECGCPQDTGEDDRWGGR